MKGPEQFHALFERAGLPADWRMPLRRAAIDWISNAGFPTTRDEDWKYTPVGPLLEPSYQVPTPVAMPGEWLEAGGAGPGHRLVFWNGRFVRALSATGAVPSGAVVGPLSEAISSAQVKQRLGSLTNTDSAFVALNTAFMEDGAFVSVPDGAELADPVELIFVADAEHGPVAIHPRNLIVLGAGAHAAIVETYLGWDVAGPYLDNAITEAVLGPGARLEHFREQLESPQAFHVARLVVDEAAGASLSSYVLAMGGRVARSEVVARLEATGGACTLNGLYVGRGDQQLDNNTRIEHLGPGCHSRELYHGILDQHARGIFTGRVLVMREAQKSDAGQTNRNLLLSDAAEAKTRPHLQILADDVKCAHGATIGELDDDALFYLRSRGIDEDSGRAMLTSAFATAVTSTLPIRAWRHRAERRLQQWTRQARR